MNQKGIELLTDKKYYVILSIATKQAYIDGDGTGYIFSAKKDAEDFLEETGHDKVYINGSSKNISRNKDIRDYFCEGMRKLHVTRRNQKTAEVEENDIEIKRGDVKKGYYNVALEFNVTRLRETALKKYVLAMKDNNFIVPVYIPSRKEKEYPKLYYCHAVFADKREALVLFSMMEEFDNWNNDMIKHKGQQFFPLEISATRVMKARNNGDIFLNPLSDKLFLTDKQLK